MIEKLEPHQVFVFGSNGQGFHGAGSAGLACRGDSRNNWRQDQWFLAAMRGGDPTGKWAVYGVARGFQQGREGMSFAIQTVTRPGAKQSVSRREIYYQLVDLWDFARANPQWEILLTPVGQGYAGWSREEMAEVWAYLEQQHGWPVNVKRWSDESVANT